MEGGGAGVCAGCGGSFGGVSHERALLPGDVAAHREEQEEEHGGERGRARAPDHTKQSR